MKTSLPYVAIAHKPFPSLFDFSFNFKFKLNSSAYLKGFLLLVFLVVAGNIKATSITTIASGDWNSSTPWPGGNIPSSTDDIIIDNGHSITFNGVISLTVASLTINGALISTAGTLTITGTFTNNGTFTHSSGTVAFTGTSQAIGGTSSTTFYNLTLNGAGTKTLGNAITVNNVLDLTSGFLKTTSTNLLTMTSGSTYSGSSNSSFVDGPMQQNVPNTGFKFPVGNGGKLAPCEISGLSSATNFKAEYFKTGYNTLTAGTGLNKVSNVEYWDINGSATATIALYFYDANFSGVLHFSTPNITVSQYNISSSKWQEVSGFHSLAAAGTGGYVSASGVSNFSDSYFTFGVPTNGINPLPVKLMAFTANPINEGALLNWSTATELNNDRFDIERSTDGKLFNKIGEVKGNNNSSSILKYSYSDIALESAIAKVYYYRLKQVDYSGVFEYSNIQAVNTNSTGRFSIITLSPNPVMQDLNLTFKVPESSTITIQIADLQGKVLYSSNTLANKGFNSLQVNTGNLSSGIYFIQLSSEGLAAASLRMVKE